MTKKRWISLFVENEMGVLARISGLFSGKAYPLDSLTVGTTEDRTVLRMTIGLTSDDRTFEQIKKQLDRSIEVIKVIDFTDAAVHRKELMFIKINGCSAPDLTKISYMREIFDARLIDCNSAAVLLECVQTENRNNAFIRLLENNFPNRIEIVRGGSVAVEAVSLSDRP